MGHQCPSTGGDFSASQKSDIIEIANTTLTDYNTASPLHGVIHQQVQSEGIQIASQLQGQYSTFSPQICYELNIATQNASSPPLWVTTITDQANDEWTRQVRTAVPDLYTKCKCQADSKSAPPCVSTSPSSLPLTCQSGTCTLDLGEDTILYVSGDMVVKNTLQAPTITGSQCTQPPA